MKHYMNSIKTSTPSRPAIVTLVAALAISSTVEARNTATPEFRKGRSGIVKIALLPPHATMTVVKVGVDESLLVESAAVEKHGSDKSLEHLDALGYQVTRLTPEQIKADQNLRELVLHANQRYEEAYDSVRRRPGQVKNRRYNLGEELQILAAYLNVDALAFQRVNIAGAAAGQMALSLFLGHSSRASFDLTIVDGDSGDVVGFYYELRSWVAKKTTANPEELLDEMIRAALNGLPAAGIKSDRASDTAKLESY